MTVKAEIRSKAESMSRKTASLFRPEARLGSTSFMASTMASWAGRGGRKPAISYGTHPWVNVPDETATYEALRNLGRAREG